MVNPPEFDFDSLYHSFGKLQYAIVALAIIS